MIKSFVVVIEDIELNGLYVAHILNINGALL